jgi:ABC-type dipeptide/oligopeptide/nickel transport system permease component
LKNLKTQKTKRKNSLTLNMKDDKKPFWEQLVEYLIDISKLTFGGVVLSVILEISQNKILILGVGFMATLVFAIWGFLLLTIKDKRK